MNDTSRPPELKTIKITEEELERYRDGYCGCCLACGKWTEGDCEPDARKYRCGFCDARKVYGAEELALMGRLEIVDG